MELKLVDLLVCNFVIIHHPRIWYEVLIAAKNETVLLTAQWSVAIYGMNSKYECVLLVLIKIMRWETTGGGRVFWCYCANKLGVNSQRFHLLTRYWRSEAKVHPESASWPVIRDEEDVVKAVIDQVQ